MFVAVLAAVVALGPGISLNVPTYVGTDISAERTTVLTNLSTSTVTRVEIPGDGIQRVSRRDRETPPTRLVIYEIGNF